MDQILTILSQKVETLERSILPFHLLDHENDVSSDGLVAFQLQQGGAQAPSPHPHQPKINQQQVLDINERIAREGTEF
ncbi:hypothetical protein ACKI18_48355, partial [Streptomyces niveiscabiei]